jgi:glyoxylase-like metal-dependent hydrolase (beta-lactamase superfamily II)
MSSQISVDPAGTVAPKVAGCFQVAPDVVCQRVGIVNVVFYGSPGTSGHDWVLIDAGISGMARKIRKRAIELFGQLSPPRAIILTHGHFDHVGVLRQLCDEWQVPVYAHPMEWPYLDGRSKYPPPDPTVGGGLMAALSGLYPRGPIDVSNWLLSLPPDGTVPFMPGWRWIATPGHTPGHISLWREADRILIAGDAFITTNQESAYAVALQKPEVHGPPMYYTQDWEQARESVRKLAALEPLQAVTGHGQPFEGPGLSTALRILADNFDAIARPKHGRYLREPARAGLDGTDYVPPKPGIAATVGRFVASPVGIGVMAGLAIAAIVCGVRRSRNE